jgi:hypothetical protein
VTITVYLPKDLTQLRREIADIHAEAAAKQMERLACPAAQKQAILQAVNDKVQSETRSVEIEAQRAVA